MVRTEQEPSCGCFALVKADEQSGQARVDIRNELHTSSDVTTV